VFVYVFLVTENPIAIGASLLLILFSAITNDGFNPAVTITMASLDKIPVSDVMPFIISQVLGGLVAVQCLARRTNWERRQFER
jgi:glycerol uptake facilitator-like aquaporin